MTIEPSSADPVVARGAEAIGGPRGTRARSGWWNPIRVLIVLAAIGYGIGFLLDVPCISNGWLSPDRYEHLCYSDIPPLYSIHGFDRGIIPYIDSAPGHTPLEYPVLTGVFMLVAAWITTAITGAWSQVNATIAFFDVNVVMLFVFLVMAVVATALTVRRRPWDAAMVALAPGVILAATINWDLVALGLTAMAMLLWARRAPAWAGVFLGLAIASKFYPVVILGPLFLLCLRAGHLRAFGRLLATTVIAWLVVNLPFMLGNLEGWSYFYRFSQTRGQDFGSPWFATYLLTGWSIPPDTLNTVATGTLLVMCAGIGWLCLAAGRRPRLAQVAFLVVAAFAITNKVYSPQYVLWMIPLAVLARPRWRDFLVWQAGEAAYFAAVWWYLVGYDDGAKGMTQQWYAFFVFVHIAFTLWFAALVVRDILRPEHDIVRTDGWPEDEDDPGGGVLDQAPDRVTLRGRAPRRSAMS